MTDRKIIPVILSGGSGTRLWPLSTPERPKQFLPLVGEDSMFAMTLRRCADADRFAAPIIVGSERHVALTDALLAETGVAPIAHILEPVARNTAPAIALAALAAPEPNSPLLVMPSDHVITDLPAFLAAVDRALTLVERDWLVTFGITPDGPETGYGYIERGKQMAEDLFAAERFVEKPDRQAAEAMLAQGGFYWNAGIFLFRADNYLDRMAQHAPDMLAACQDAFRGAERNGAYLRPDAAAFERCPSDSIDYAVMEKADKVAVAPVDPGWSDVGSWDALAELLPAGQDGNVMRGDAILDNAKDNLVIAQGVTVAIHGVDELIVVADGDNVLILPKGHSQAVKALHARLAERRDKGS